MQTMGKPILFSPEMIRALKKGVKTQTRRTMKAATCPFGEVGELLYVREDYQLPAYLDSVSPSGVTAPNVKIHYTADGDSPFSGMGKPRSNMYMPRWMSRMTLELTGVKSEKLKEISHEDVLAEGISSEQAYEAIAGQSRYFIGEAYQKAYAALWDKLHGSGAWDVNPFVWVLRFKVHHCNIDELIKDGFGAE